MNKAITESDLLRLSMIFDNQSATTRDKCICKIVECVLFDDASNELSLNEISQAIKARFQLEFDLLEIAKAIQRKGRGRIIESNQQFKLTAKVIDQLSTQQSVVDQLRECVCEFASMERIDADDLLSLIQKHIYYCFNSNANNFKSIIGNFKKADYSVDNESFNPTQDEIDIINRFMGWNNAKKNKLIYSIVSSSYEYCLITSNKNPTIPKAIFKNKRFFLDTNIIFRIVGLNKEERRFVVKTFVEKCREAGISLCYTSSVNDEIFRVIKSQITRIQQITKTQPPLEARLFSKIIGESSLSDFYQLYYNWCKEPNNDYLDFAAFARYLFSKINTVLTEFEFYDSSKVLSQSKREEDLFNSLLKYKSEKISYKNTTIESVKTDIAQILFVEKMRPLSARSIWDLNEYIVSADQVLASWAENHFNGAPLVVLPSLWLSMLLKISGRATENDYQSFCLFMSLPQMPINKAISFCDPIELLSRLSEKTIDGWIKEQIITEFLSNRSDYSFDSERDLDNSIDKAFDKILQQKDKSHQDELTRVMEEERKDRTNERLRFQQELEKRKTAEEYAKEIAIAKAQKRINFFAHTQWIPIIIILVGVLTAVFCVVALLAKISPFYELLANVINSENVNDRVWSVIFWCICTAILTIPTYIKKLWSCLSSDKRKERLLSKYYRKQCKVIQQIEKSDGL